MLYTTQHLRGFWSQLYLFLRTYRPHPVILFGLCLLAAVTLLAIALILFVLLFALLAVALFGVGLVALWAMYRGIITVVQSIGKWLAVLLISLDLAAKITFEPETTQQQAEQPTHHHTSATRRTRSQRGRRVSRTRYFYPSKSAPAP